MSAIDKIIKRAEDCACNDCSDLFPTAQAELITLRSERDDQHNALADTIAELRGENTRLQSLVNKLGDPSQNSDFKWHDLYGWMQQDQHRCVTDDTADLKAERDQYREIAGELAKELTLAQRTYRQRYMTMGTPFDTTLARWTEMEGKK